MIFRSVLFGIFSLLSASALAQDHIIEQGKMVLLPQPIANTIFTPYKGSPARIYGSYNNGCLEGAIEVKDKGHSFQIQRWGENRSFAHPLMYTYIQDLLARTKAAGLPPLLLGDISRPYGGQLGSSSMHSSHQIGLDIDIPFDFASPRKSAQELHHPHEVYIVKGEELLPGFTPQVEQLIKIAASDPRVERIFVAPMIKRHMCEVFAGKEGDSFLHVLRPWFGHRAHMHVRLQCPFDSPDCRHQDPVPEGTGCGSEVDSWFLPPPPQSNKPKPKRPPKVLPPQCQLILGKAQ